VTLQNVSPSDGQAINSHPIVDVLNSIQAIDVTGGAGTFKF
jgi:hypothetical protein